MARSLRDEYGLTDAEVLELINERFRLKNALEGGIAEFQMEKHVAALVGSAIDRYEAIDKDKTPDFKLWLPNREEPVWAECKKARNKPYQRKGVATHYALELQKTRASKGDPLSRFYDAEHFQIVGVCLGNHTGDWSDFMFIRSEDLTKLAAHPHKFEVMHRIPIPGSGDYGPWSDNLADIIENL